ncbi:hypothetical protein ADIS_1134 [Lunatimonas lonarensis]|uniref:DUF5668 domain-containing protein n=1 Tax=Lunatimonas lonarensis TaxID=1232681 RepID=R7ZVU2_9BACT|nr:hypothetical protein ADIS_1134 [Lunatimonas lonarensis]
MTKKIPYSVYFLLIGTSLSAQSENQEMDGFPFLDYWPVLLLPVFGIIVYRFWKRSSRRSK